MIPPSRTQHDPHDRQHRRDLGQHAHYGRQCWNPKNAIAAATADSRRRPFADSISTTNDRPLVPSEGLSVDEVSLSWPFLQLVGSSGFVVHLASRRQPTAPDNERCSAIILLHSGRRRLSVGSRGCSRCQGLLSLKGGQTSDDALAALGCPLRGTQRNNSSEPRCLEVMMHNVSCYRTRSPREQIGKNQFTIYFIS